MKKYNCPCGNKKYVLMFLCLKNMSKKLLSKIKISSV